MLVSILVWVGMTSTVPAIEALKVSCHKVLHKGICVDFVTRLPEYPMRWSNSGTHTWVVWLDAINPGWATEMLLGMTSTAPGYPAIEPH